MARHRDIRNMDYADEYDGYDDIYGHSVEDDYYISPSNRQFIYNRDSSRDSRFEHEDDIQEVDEVDELSDIEKAKLNSCIDEIKNTLGPTAIPRSEVVNLILKYKFNNELVVNAILEDTRCDKASGVSKDKDVTDLLNNSPLKNRTNISKNVNEKSSFMSSSAKSFVIPNLFGSNKSVNTNKSSPKNFDIPNIFKSQPTELINSGSPKSFAIPNIFGSGSPKNVAIQNSSGSSPKINTFTIPRLSDSKSAGSTDDDNFNTLSELVSSHLKNTLPEDLAMTNISQKVLDMQISEPPKETRSLMSNDIKYDFNIDLSKALKTTGSLPILQKNNKENVSEKFDIPFIDSDSCLKKGPKPSLVKNKDLPCILAINNILDFNSQMSKNPSKFGKVIGRKYKHRKEGSFNNYHLKWKYPVPKAVKVFKFHTQSPDDFISSHLKR